jgi:hypothetical protein
MARDLLSGIQTIGLSRLQKALTEFDFTPAAHKPRYSSTLAIHFPSHQIVERSRVPVFWRGAEAHIIAYRPGTVVGGERTQAIPIKELGIAARELRPGGQAALWSILTAKPEHHAALGEHNLRYIRARR